MDVNSGSVHVVDDIVYDMIPLIEPLVNEGIKDPDTIKARIQEAAQYIPLDRLCLSTQCGFASTQEGNKLTEDQQWAKIALVQSIAKDVWGE